MKIMHKIKYIAAAVAAIGSAAAFAAPLDPLTQSPDVTFYIAGASAQKAGIQFISASKFFQNASDVVYIVSSLTKNTTNFSDPLNFPQGSIGFFGVGKDALTGGTNKKLLVLFSSANGSAAGINQVIAADGSAPEANVVNVGASANCVANGSTSAGTTGSVLSQFKCSGYTARVADVALSDVNIDEFPAGVVVGDPSSLTETRQTALEGFGVVVNNNLYYALQVQNVADGLLSASCTTGFSATTYNNTAACQPTISKSQYANVITSGYSDAHGLVPSAVPAATPLNLYRRVPTSGTQAASSIYFLSNPCQSLLGRAQTPTAQGNYGNFHVIEGSQTDDVLTAMKVTTAGTYNIGVVSLEKADSDLGSDASTYKGRFVRIDGQSPIYPDGATLDGKRRIAIQKGNYDFAVEMAAYVGGTTKTDLVTELLNDIVDPSLTNIAGVAYLQGTFDATRSASVSRAANNCNGLQ